MDASPLPRDLWTDEEFILKHGQEARRLPWPMFLGKLMRRGWTGRIPTYLIWCRDCHDSGESDGFTVTHEAGHARRLACRTCRKRFEMRLPQRWLRRFWPAVLTLTLLFAAVLVLVPWADLALLAAVITAAFFFSKT